MPAFPTMQPHSPATPLPQGPVSLRLFPNTTALCSPHACEQAFPPSSAFLSGVKALLPSAHPAQDFGDVTADSPGVSFPCQPLDPSKDDFKHLQCLIMPPLGICCASLKIEARQCDPASGSTARTARRQSSPRPTWQEQLKRESPGRSYV